MQVKEQRPAAFGPRVVPCFNGIELGNIMQIGDSSLGGVFSLASSLASTCASSECQDGEDTASGLLMFERVEIAAVPARASQLTADLGAASPVTGLLATNIDFTACLDKQEEEEEGKEEALVGGISICSPGDIKSQEVLVGRGSPNSLEREERVISARYLVDYARLKVSFQNRANRPVDMF
ncbi:MAG: hypothetical protein SGCHY_002926 [Lobulomycetales sp.]